MSVNFLLFYNVKHNTRLKHIILVQMSDVHHLSLHVLKNSTQSAKLCKNCRFRIFFSFPYLLIAHNLGVCSEQRNCNVVVLVCFGVGKILLPPEPDPPLNSRNTVLNFVVLRATASRQWYSVGYAWIPHTVHSHFVWSSGPSGKNQIF